MYQRVLKVTETQRITSQTMHV